jgi:enamine deaminase RidA (YjgF/YER057c/UK114 family)
MTANHINPVGLAKPSGYTHVVTVEGKARLVFISGQVALNMEGKIVGAGDLKAQIRQVIGNLKLALKSAGATLNQIVKLNTFIVNYEPADLIALREVRRELFGPGEAPASTLIGVGSLALDGLMVEMEAVAAVPESAIDKSPG